MTTPNDLPLPVAYGLLDPDMPAQELRLHMGEITNQEARTARAAIRWANSRAMAEIERLKELESITLPAPANRSGEE